MVNGRTFIAEFAPLSKRAEAKIGPVVVHGALRPVGAVVLPRGAHRRLFPAHHSEPSVRARASNAKGLKYCICSTPSGPTRMKMRKDLKQAKFDPIPNNCKTKARTRKIGVGGDTNSQLVETSHELR